MELGQKNLGDPLRCLTVPQGQPPRLLMGALQRFVKLRPEQIPILPNQNVRAQRESDGAPRVFTQCQATRAQIGRLLLNPPLVCDDNLGILSEEREYRGSRAER